MKVLTYRYLWTKKGSDKVNFKIVSDIEEGLKKFEEQLFLLADIEKCGREYLHEYDCEKIGKFETLLGGEENEA